MKQCRFLGKSNIGVCYNEDSQFYEQDCVEFLKINKCTDSDLQVVTKRFCNRCNSPVFKSNTGNKTNGYKYQCFECDEDLFEFETHTKSKN